MRIHSAVSNAKESNGKKSVNTVPDWSWQGQQGTGYFRYSGCVSQRKCRVLDRSRFLPLWSFELSFLALAWAFAVCLFCFVWSFVVVAGVVARLDQSIQGIEVSSAVLKEKSTLNKLVADEDIDSD